MSFPVLESGNLEALLGALSVAETSVQSQDINGVYLHEEGLKDKRSIHLAGTEFQMLSTDTLDDNDSIAKSFIEREKFASASASASSASVNTATKYCTVCTAL